MKGWVMVGPEATVTPAELEKRIERGRAFAETYQMRANGGAAERAADHILAVGASRSHST